MDTLNKIMAVLDLFGPMSAEAISAKLREANFFMHIDGMKHSLEHYAKHGYLIKIEHDYLGVVYRPAKRILALDLYPRDKDGNVRDLTAEEVAEIHKGWKEGEADILTQADHGCSPTSMFAMGVCSDIQHMIEHGMLKQAYETLNNLKALIDQRMATKDPQGRHDYAPGEEVRRTQAKLEYLAAQRQEVARG